MAKVTAAPHLATRLGLRSSQLGSASESPGEPGPSPGDPVMQVKAKTRGGLPLKTTKNDSGPPTSYR